MNTAIPRTTFSKTRYGSIDEAIGPRATRFFGEGFKRVGHRVTDIEVRPQGQGARVSGTASVTMPANWSRKGEAEQRPHLSTIDAMLLAARLTGLRTAHVQQLAPDATFEIRSLSISAGSTPDEDDLDGFAVSGAHLATTDRGSGASTTMRCTIGSMTVDLTADHSGGKGHRTGAGWYGDESALPGPWLDAPFGISHHSRSQLLHDVMVDTGELTASARLELRASSGEDQPSETPTMVDLFVSALQLGQVLLYDLDGVSRTDSNTLWMRSTRITPVTSPASNDDRFQTRLARAILLPTDRGTWRSAHIVAALGGHELTCRVTHLLPNT